MKKKVVVGLSGGVDSSAAAYLLKEQGYEVLGVTVTLWQEDPEKAALFNASAVADAKRIAEALGIPHETLNYAEAFRCQVVERFAEDYIRGFTPNPCVLCNRAFKWEALLEYADRMGADYIATGHYAGIGRLPNGRYSVFRAASDKKDQTYALYRLTQDQLSRTLMPLGSYEKEEIRRIAEKIDGQIAKKHDSQEICFIPDDDHVGFLSRYLQDRMPGPGNFVDAAGNVLGSHQGIACYTIGQRKGLGLAMGHPVFVTEICPEDNTVVIGENEDLFKNTLEAREVNYMGIPSLPPEGLRATAKIRYAHKGADCLALPTENGFTVRFDEPQRAITRGQSVVLYRENYLLAGGVIWG